MQKFIIDNWQEIIEQYDVFHSNVDPLFIKLCKDAQAHGKRWIHTYHSIYTVASHGKLKNWMRRINTAQRTIACDADVCICVNKWLMQEYKHSNPIYIPNFVDTTALNNIELLKITIPSYCNQKYILFIGDESINKNSIDIIHAAALLPQYTFIFAGLFDNTLNGTLCDLIASTTNITMIGSLSHDKCIDYIKECSILVITSILEGLPTVLLEAMYYNKLCIIPTGPKWSKNLSIELESNHNYPIGNITALADTITSIMENPQTCTDAKRLVESHFSTNAIRKQLDDIYLT
jgi:hypothetical protein